MGHFVHKVVMVNLKNAGKNRNRTMTPLGLVQHVLQAMEITIPVILGDWKGVDNSLLFSFVLGNRCTEPWWSSEYFCYSDQQIW